MVRHDDGSMGDLFSDELHSRFFESLSEERVAISDNQRGKITVLEVYSQSLSTGSMSCVRVTRYGKCGNVAEPFDGILRLSGICQKIEVLDLLGGPLKKGQGLVEADWQCDG